MLFDLITAARLGNADLLKQSIASLLLALPIILLALCVHETAHGYAANKLGDPTARSLGRLTLNPIKHLDPIGFLCMLAFGFGWAKPVPINSRYFKKPRRDMAISAAAGPVSNLLLALIFTLLFRLYYSFILSSTTLISTSLGANMVYFAGILIMLGIRLNVGLAVFNLLPVPPLDGSKILYLFLPPKLYFKISQYERYIYFALLILLAVGVITPIISFVSSSVIDLFLLIFGFDSSEMAIINYLFS